MPSNSLAEIASQPDSKSTKKSNHTLGRSRKRWLDSLTFGSLEQILHLGDWSKAVLHLPESTSNYTEVHSILQKLAVDMTTHCYNQLPWAQLHWSASYICHTGHLLHPKQRAQQPTYFNIYHPHFSYCWDCKLQLSCKHHKNMSILQVTWHSWTSYPQNGQVPSTYRSARNLEDNDNSLLLPKMTVHYYYQNLLCRPLLLRKIGSLYA